MDRCRRGQIAAGVAALAMLATLAAPGLVGWRALAHAQLLVSSPAAGEVVPEAPSQLVLVFSEPLEAGFSSVDLIDADGADVLRGAGEVDPADPFQLTVALPPLDDGVYSVSWRTLSAADGHTTSGFFSFGVGRVGAPLPAGGVDHDHGAADPLTGIGRGIGYLGLLAGVGVPVIATAVLRRSLRPRFMRLVGGLLIASALAALALAIRSALGPAGGGEVTAYLLDSRSGSLQVARAAVMAGGGLSVIALAGRWRRGALATAVASALVGIGLMVAAGHAAALPGIAPLAGQTVHVAAVGVWLSGVVMLGVLAVRPRLAIDVDPAFRDLVPRFSALALVSIGLVGVTGFYASWSQTGALLDPSTDYGRLLVIKLGLALAALGLGGLNHLDGGRLLGWLGGLRRRLLAELGLAAAILVVTGLLSATPPLGVQGVEIEPLPDAFGRVTPGMSLELLPGRPGVNQVAVAVEGALGTPTLELMLDRLDTGEQTRIPLRRLGSGDDIAHGPGADHTDDEAGPGDDAADHFTADAVVLPADSRWDASVRVLAGSGGTELSRQRYAFAMGDAEVVEGRVRSLLSIGFGMAGLLVIGGALAVGLALGGARLPRTDPLASRVALVGGGTVAVGLGILIGMSQMAAGGTGLTALDPDEPPTSSPGSTSSVGPDRTPDPRQSPDAGDAVGDDGLPVAELLPRELDGVELHTFAVGQASVERLLAHIGASPAELEIAYASEHGARFLQLYALRVRGVDGEELREGWAAAAYDPADGEVNRSDATMGGRPVTIVNQPASAAQVGTFYLYVLGDALLVAQAFEAEVAADGLAALP